MLWTALSPTVLGLDSDSRCHSKVGLRLDNCGRIGDSSKVSLCLGDCGRFGDSNQVGLGLGNCGRFGDSNQVGLGLGNCGRLSDSDGDGFSASISIFILGMSHYASASVED